jgi:hypothetical protein
MSPPKAYKALCVTLLGMALGCGDPGIGDEVGALDASIVGGWAASEAQIFATVEIRRAGAGHGFCSGALISPSLVLTAAHCAVVEPEPGDVRIASPGSLWVVAGHLSSSEATEDMIRPVAGARVHDDYDHDFIMGRSREGAGQGGIGSPNDIAILFLSRPFDHIPLAPLLTTERERELVRHGDVAFVAGYGVYDLDAGQGGALYISDAVIDIIGQRELLTRRSDQLGDSCYGDSGGPLYVPTEDGDFLVGLVSRGRSDVKRDCGDGGVYTLVSVHLPWIAEAAAERFQPRMEASGDEHSFVADGVEGIQAPKGGAIKRAQTCAASTPGSDGSEPVSLVALLVVCAWPLRRLSRC